jgi:hypothetical protein
MQRTVADLADEFAASTEHDHQPGTDCPACVGDPSLVQTPIVDDPPVDAPPPRTRGTRRNRSEG